MSFVLATTWASSTLAAAPRQQCCIVLHFLTTSLQFRILGSDYKDALLEIIAPESLPAEYGGTCTCGMTVEAGQPRTETCVSPVCALTLPEMLELAGFRPLALAAGAESTVHLDVAAADGSAIVWYWNADDKDVLCEITFTPVDSHAGGATLYILTESKLTKHKGWFVPPSAGRLALGSPTSTRGSRLNRCSIACQQGTAKASAACGPCGRSLSRKATTCTRSRRLPCSRPADNRITPYVRLVSSISLRLPFARS